MIELPGVADAFIDGGITLHMSEATMPSRTAIEKILAGANAQLLDLSEAPVSLF